jgi:hypothetical protein
MTEIETTLQHLEAMPGFLSQLVQIGDQTLFQTKPAGHYFSFTEHLWHLRDLEIEGYARRIRGILEENAPQMPDFDGDAVARERRYLELDWREGFAQFRGAREANVQRLRQVSTSDWLRRGVLEGRGDITLVDLIGLMRTHDAEHASEIAHLAYGCDIWKMHAPVNTGSWRAA